MTQLGEYVKMALKNIWANKVRTLLTMLGIIIGISSVIMIISIGGGATELIASELGGLGKGQIEFGVSGYDEKYTLTQEELDEIEKIDGVKAAVTQDVLDGTMRTKKDEFDVTVIALNPSGFEFEDYTYINGGPYTQQDAETGKSVCVISEKDAMKLFGSTNVVGMDMDLTVIGCDMTVTIVGVTKTENDTMLEAMLADPSVQVILPPQALSTTIGIDLSSEIYWFTILKEKDADAETVCNAVVDYLEIKHHCKGQNIYYYSSYDDIMETVNSVMDMITLFIAFVASVSLLVGGIGVMNIMLVSVTERTREIGIRKSLGAKTGSITVQFLAESAFITMIGGILGIIVGVGGAWVISAIIGMAMPQMNFAPELKVSTVLLAVTFSSVVGIFFGIYPARKAAKLSPIEALRRN